MKAYHTMQPETLREIARARVAVHVPVRMQTESSRYAVVGTQAPSSAKGERNDCTVRALAAVTALTYEQAHERIRILSHREQGCGTNAERAYLQSGGRLISFCDGRTLARWLADHPRGFYIVETSRHAMGVIDGKIVSDRFVTGARSRIVRAYAFPDPTNGN